MVSSSHVGSSETSGAPPALDGSKRNETKRNALVKAVESWTCTLSLSLLCTSTVSDYRRTLARAVLWIERHTLDRVAGDMLHRSLAVAGTNTVIKNWVASVTSLA